jgi:general secretion pathway protein D
MTAQRPIRLGLRSLLAGLALCLLLAACATYTVIDDARQLFEQGRGEEALALLDKAASEADADPAVRTEYNRQRDLLAGQWFAQAEAMRQAKQYQFAALLYQRILKYDPRNARARASLTQLETDVRHQAMIASAQKLAAAGQYREARELLRPVLEENPTLREALRLKRRIDDKLTPSSLAEVQLKPSSNQPLSLELRDVSLRALFEVLSRTYGINIVLDKDVKADQRTSIALREASFEEAMRLILMTNQLEQKVSSSTTLVVYPNNPAKRREYQELVVKSFYLANADVKQTATMIRSVLKTRDIFVDEKVNLVVIRDTPEAVRIAERLIAAQDLAEPEVMLEVEVLEVGVNRLTELGLKYPDSMAVFLQGAAGTPGAVRLDELQNFSSSLVQLLFPNPTFLLSLKQQDGSTSVLANPRIRVKNREKAKIHIGDRVPVITTTAAATGGFVSESVSYLDVGLKLDVEPIVYLDDEVGIKVGLEVSRIVREIRSTSGTLVYQIGTRNANTLLRLRDGETQVLAGLISDEDRRVADRVPGLGELPTLGRLFSSQRDENIKTQIVLLITPRLVRTLAQPAAHTVEFSAKDAEAVPQATPAAPRPVPRVAPPAQPAQPAPAAPQGSEMRPFGGVVTPGDARQQ